MSLDPKEIARFIACKANWNVAGESSVLTLEGMNTGLPELLTALKDLFPSLRVLGENAEGKASILDEPPQHGEVVLSVTTEELRQHMGDRVPRLRGMTRTNRQR